MTFARNIGDSGIRWRESERHSTRLGDGRVGVPIHRSVTDRNTGFQNDGRLGCRPFDDAQVLA